MSTLILTKPETQAAISTTHLPKQIAKWIVVDGQHVCRWIASYSKEWRDLSE